MSDRPRLHKAPGDLVFGLGTKTRRGQQISFDEFTAAIVARIEPPPVFRGLENSRILDTAAVFTRPGYDDCGALALGIETPPTRTPIAIGPFQLIALGMLAALPRRKTGCQGRRG